MKKIRNFLPLQNRKQQKPLENGKFSNSFKTIGFEEMVFECPENQGGFSRFSK